MSDYRGMFDRDYIGAWDLEGHDVTVTISRVTPGELVGEGGRKTKKPIIYFERKEKGFAANKTNCKIIAAMYGTDTRKWIGRCITLFPTTTEMAGKQHDCIRVRPQIPRGDEPRRDGSRGNGPKQEETPPTPEAPND